MADFLGFDAERLQALRAAAPGFARRQAKHLKQARYGWDHDRSMAFVFGCQRSGTKMVMRILDNSPAIRIYHENHLSAFDGEFQLRSDRTLKALARLSPAPVQIFKPICDSQEADLILDRFAEARGLWIFRDPDDVANSAVEKWGAHQRDVIDAIVKGETGEEWGWRTARIPAAVRAEVAAVHRPDLSEHEGALLFWYVRNRLFTALGLHTHERVRLVDYRRLVTEPAAAFEQVFHHVGAPFDATWVERVHAGSLGRNPAPAASPEIRALVDGLLAELRAWQAPTPARLKPPAAALVLINTLGIGGAERYVVTISNWMVKQGLRVAVAAQKGRLVDELDDAILYRDMDLHGVRADLPLAAGKVRALIEESGAEVIITNSLATALVARAAQLGKGLPVINVAHGWPADRYRTVAPLMRAADAVVAVSPDVRDKLADAGMDADRIHVVFNGVDCSGRERRVDEVRAQARAAMGVSEDEQVCIIVGRTEAQKAHQHVIALARRMRESHPTLKFALVGSGSRDQELAELVEGEGVGDRVNLMGLRRDVADLLGSADIFLNCSDWEGMPLTTIEAMAGALPIVATKTEGSDQLLDTDSGIVVPVGDVDAMAEALGRLVEDHDARVTMGEHARARALSEFSHERMSAELLAVATRVLRG